MERKLFKELKKAFIIVSVFLKFALQQMLYNVVLVFTVRPSASATHIHVISSFVVLPS